jgi:hypothetical protein
MALVGDLKDGENHTHTDEHDIISIFVTLGHNIQGGSTLYFDGANFSSKDPEKTRGKQVYEVPFQHGQIQVGPFEQVAHAGQPWKGRRGVISFYLNKPIVDHFQEHGDKLYMEHRAKMYGEPEASDGEESEELGSENEDGGDMSTSDDESVFVDWMNQTDTENQGPENESEELQDDMAVDEQPEAQEESDPNAFGSGGCAAHALWKLGIFNTVEGAKAVLNDKGEQVYKKRCEEVRSDYPKEKVYKANDYWTIEVIKLAVVEADHHFEKIDLDEVCLKSHLSSGKYLIDGVQNRLWQQGRGAMAAEYHNAAEYQGPGPDMDPGAWRHAIAVVDGQIKEQNEHTFSAAWLWLNKDNEIDLGKGYMRKIFKVYKITPRPDTPETSSPIKRASSHACPAKIANKRARN